MSYKVLEVADKRLFKQFIEFPYKLYKKSKYWTPPLFIQERDFYKPEKNKFFEHSIVKLFLCFKDCKLVGRISANINHNYNSFHNEKIGFWGSFETINDSEVVGALFNAITGFFKEQGVSVIRGPFTFSTNEICGLLVDKFDMPPLIMMPYNFEYYEKLLIDDGHRKIKDLFRIRSKIFVNFGSGQKIEVCRVADKTFAL